jgi:hypothetical protein
MTQPVHAFNTALPSLTLHVAEALLPSFFRFLQSGFLFGALVGCSIRELLCEQLGLDEEYVSSRITTIFLNGKPVDDIDAVVVRGGSVLSLSAAMPGLVGAAMRRGGRYAFLRDSITQERSVVSSERRPGIVEMKLFNMVMEELGPTFLKKGIILKTAELARFFNERPDEFWGGCSRIALDGTILEPGHIRDGSAFPGEERMVLSVVRDNPDPPPK